MHVGVSCQAAGTAIATAAKTYKLKGVDVDVSHLTEAGPGCITSLVAASITGWSQAATACRVDCSAQLTSRGSARMARHTGTVALLSYSIAAALPSERCLLVSPIIDSVVNKLHCCCCFHCTGLYEGNVRYRSKPEPKGVLAALQLLVGPHGQAAAVEAAARGVALAQGTLMARYLIEAPANVCTPRHLAAAAAHIQALNPDRFALKVAWWCSMRHACTMQLACRFPLLLLASQLFVCWPVPHPSRKAHTHSHHQRCSPAIASLLYGSIGSHANDATVCVGQPTCVWHGLPGVQVLEEGDCRKLGMGLFLGVAQGSDEPLRFIHLTYTPEGPVTQKVGQAPA